MNTIFKEEISALIKNNNQEFAYSFIYKGTNKWKISELKNSHKIVAIKES